MERERADQAESTVSACFNGELERERADQAEFDSRHTRRSYFCLLSMGYADVCLI